MKAIEKNEAEEEERMKSTRKKDKVGKQIWELSREIINVKGKKMMESDEKWKDEKKLERG